MNAFLCREFLDSVKFLPKITLLLDLFRPLQALFRVFLASMRPGRITMDFFQGHFFSLEGFKE